MVGSMVGALAGDVDDQVLVVEDQRVGLPAVAGPGVVDGEAGLELGDPGDLAGDQHLTSRLLPRPLGVMPPS